jgi:hypothetical protein
MRGWSFSTVCIVFNTKKNLIWLFVGTVKQGNVVLAPLKSTGDLG